MENTTQPEVVKLTAQPEANPEASQPKEVETTAIPASQPKIKVKYNKEEKELSLDEAREYAEKGMNYDKIKERFEETSKKLQQFEESELLKAAKLLAEDMGDSLDGVGQKLRKQFYDKKDRERAESEGITVEAARQLREKDEQLKHAVTKAQTVEKQLAEREQQDAELVKWQTQLTEFQNNHKDLNAFELAQNDEDVKKYWALGMTFEDAYNFALKDKKVAKLEEEIKTMSEQLGITKTNSENAEASTGAFGGGATQEKPLTQEEVDKMTKKDFDNPKTWERVRRFYGFKD